MRRVTSGTLVGVIAVLAALLASSANADDAAGRQAFDSLYIFPGVYLAPSRNSVKSDYGVQATFGTSLNRWFDLELLSETRRLEPADGGLRSSERGASIQGLFKILPDRPLIPFLSGGAGWVRSSYDGRHDDVPLTRAGGGLIWKPFDAPLSLRGDASWRREYDNKAVVPGTGSYASDWVYSLGLSYQLNFLASDPASAHAVVAAPVVYPDEMMAPKAIVTSTGVTVTNTVSGHNCTINRQTNACIGSPDADGDGVPDADDRCPDTPPNAVVDADGCFLYMKSGV